ncbi:hypothetical protein T06_3720 [Trichinella sp. T6]|nr:hypothetical protein T06_3720 [Trichinella sp. T6]
MSGSSSPPDRQTVDGTLWFWSWLCQIADTPVLSHQPRSYGHGLSAASLVLRNDRKCRSPAPWPPCPPRHQAVGRPRATLKSNRTPPRCSDCRVEFLLVAPPGPSPLAGRAGQPGFWPANCIGACSLLVGAARTAQVTARGMVVDGSQDFWDVSSGNHLQHLFFFARCPVPSILYPVLPTHDTGFRPAASAGPVVTKGFGTCDSLPVVLGGSPSSPTTPEFVGAPGQHPATPGSARSVPVSWPPLARLRLDSWLRTAFRLVGTGRQRSGVVVQAGSRKFLSHLSSLWSVRAVNFLPYRYGRKWRVTQTRASISRRVAQYFFSGCDSERLAVDVQQERPVKMRVGQNWRAGQGTLELGQGSPLFWPPAPPLAFLGQIMERTRDTGKVLDKPSIIRSEAHELLDFFYAPGSGPLLHRRCFFRVCPYTVLCYDMAQVTYTSTHELAFLWPDLQPHGLQAVEHLGQSFQMFLFRAPVDYNVVGKSLVRT